jgi:hypothetical protein
MSFALFTLILGEFAVFAKLLTYSGGENVRVDPELLLFLDPGLQLAELELGVKDECWVDDEGFEVLFFLPGLLVELPL